MKLNKFIGIVALFVLMFSVGVNALTAKAGTHDATDGYWYYEQTTAPYDGGCWSESDGCGIDGKNVYTDYTASGCNGKDFYQTREITFHLDSITSYLDSLHGAGTYTITSSDFTYCGSGSDVDIDNDFDMKYGTSASYSCGSPGAPEAASQGYEDKSSIGGGYYKFTNLFNDATVPTEIRIYDGKWDALDRDANSMDFQTSGTCTPTAVDIGGTGSTSNAFMTYTYEMNYVTYWNLTAPENETVYSAGQPVRIEATNITETTANYNVSYKLDGGAWVDLLEEVNQTVNESLGLLPEGIHNLTVNFTTVDGANADIFTRTFNTTSYWNLTAPINNSQIPTTTPIYITGNTTGSGVDWNVYYRVDGGAWSNLLASPTDTDYNVSIGTISTTGFHTIEVNHTLVSDPSSAELFSRTVAIGNIVDFCSAFTQIAFNFTFYNEETDTRLNNVSYGMTIYTDNDAFNISSGGYTNGDEVLICTNDNSTGFVANFIVEYENATGAFYQPRTYFNVFSYSGSDPTDVKLYLLDATKATPIQIDVQDENAIPFKSTYVQAWLFDAATNTYKTVDSLITNDNGRGIIDIDIDEKLYKFEVVSYSDSSLFTTTTNNVIDDFIIKVIGAVEKTLEVLNNLIYNLQHSLTIDEDTKLITLTWNDIDNNLISQACLKIENRSLNGITEVNDSCSTSEVGTIVYNYTNTNKSDLKAIFYGKATEDNNYYDIATEIIQNVKDYINYKGNEGFFALLIIGTLAGLGVATGSASFAIIFGLFGLIITWFMGMLAISSYSLWGLAVAIILILIMRRRVT